MFVVVKPDHPSAATFRGETHCYTCKEIVVPHHLAYTDTFIVEPVEFTIDGKLVKIRIWDQELGPLPMSATYPEAEEAGKVCRDANTV